MEELVMTKIPKWLSMILRTKRITRVSISSCRRFIGKEWCPVEYDSHCMLNGKIETLGDDVPKECPLRKHSFLLELKNA